jgi:hypothetical protein
MADELVDLIVTSIPFGEPLRVHAQLQRLRPHGRQPALLGQMDYLTPQLLRVLKPGRIYAVPREGPDPVRQRHWRRRAHRLPVPRGGARPLLKHGFDYLGMITVTTDVVRENNQTYRLGYTEMRKDGTKMGVGSPEYMLLFHKPQTDRSKGYADERIVKDDRRLLPRPLADRRGRGLALLGEPAAHAGRAHRPRPRRPATAKLFKSSGCSASTTSRSTSPSLRRCAARSLRCRRRSSPSIPAPGSVRLGRREPDAHPQRRAVAPQPRVPHLPAAVRHRRPAHRALLEPRRARLRPVRRPRHGSAPRPEARPTRTAPSVELKSRTRRPPWTSGATLPGVRVVIPAQSTRESS